MCLCEGCDARDAQLCTNHCPLNGATLSVQGTRIGKLYCSQLQLFPLSHKQFLACPLYSPHSVYSSRTLFQTPSPTSKGCRNHRLHRVYQSLCPMQAQLQCHLASEWIRELSSQGRWAVHGKVPSPEQQLQFWPCSLITQSVMHVLLNKLIDAIFFLHSVDHPFRSHILSLYPQATTPSIVLFPSSCISETFPTKFWYPDIGLLCSLVFHEWPIFIHHVKQARLLVHALTYILTFPVFHDLSF